ncbi:MAG: hypothetical protein ACXWH7_04595, partial [Thermoanaerobaculia bacterium]
DDSTDHFPEDCRLANTLSELAEEFGGGEDRQECDEQLRDGQGVILRFEWRPDHPMTPAERRPFRTPG